MPGRRPEDTRLSDAFRVVYESAGIPQTQIADAIPGVDQPTVSKWARGERPPPLWALPLIEQVCGVRRGTILRHAGYVDDDIDLETAIETAPDVIDATDRSALLGLYRVFKARHLGNGNVMPSPRTPGMTRAEEALDRATEEQRRRDAPPAAG